ncbi:MAG: hypothetical protein ACYC2K_02225, partial [Gemmatimonadales bacterium]
MVKTKVQDLATEFGVPTEQLMSVLKEMHVVVRGPLHPLDDAQVAAVRLRWEREKRKQATAEEPKKARRKTTKAAAAPPPPAAPVSTAKRRRTAAEVAESEAAAQAEAEKAAAETASFEREKPVLFERPEPPTSAPMPTLDERARALFKDLPPTPASEPEAEPEPVEEAPPAPKAVTPPPPPLPPIPPRTVLPPSVTSSGEGGPPARRTFVPPRVQRGPAGP